MTAAERPSEVEALAKAVYRSEHVNLAMRDPLDIDCYDVAWGVLASDWLAAHDAQVRADALTEVADFCQPVYAEALGAGTSDFADGWRQASALILGELRDRATALAPTPPAEEGTCT